jgi:hypothetical protein
MLPLAPALAVIVYVEGSPIAKSLNAASPVACVDVAVRVPTVGFVHVPPVFFATTNLFGSPEPWMSPGTKLNVAS